MTEQQQSFINAYFSNHFNATRAARKAGYASPEQSGYRLKHDSEIAAEIKRRMDEYAMDANEALARVADIARSSMEDFVVIKDGDAVVSMTQAYKRGAFDNVKTLRPNEFGTAITLHDKQAALTTILKVHGLLKEGKEEPPRPQEITTIREVVIEKARSAEPVED